MSRYASPAASRMPSGKSSAGGSLQPPTTALQKDEQLDGGAHGPARRSRGHLARGPYLPEAAGDHVEEHHHATAVEQKLSPEGEDALEAHVEVLLATCRSG